jgi:soluble lytic murein transglycosylase-like protein
LKRWCGIAPSYGLQPSLVLAVIEAESGFNSQARSVKDAQGLMQLIPGLPAIRRADPYDPVQNLHGGMAYLRWLLAYFRGDVRLTLAGYNAGEGAVVRYRRCAAICGNTRLCRTDHPRLRPTGTSASGTRNPPGSFAPTAVSCWVCNGFIQATGRIGGWQRP